LSFTGAALTAGAVAYAMFVSIKSERTR